jgi:hypothetical protein
VTLQAKGLDSKKKVEVEGFYLPSRRLGKNVI